MIIKNINELTSGDTIKITFLLCQSMGTRGGIVKDIKEDTIYYWGYNFILDDIEEKVYYVGDSLIDGYVQIELC